MASHSDTLKTQKKDDTIDNNQKISGKHQKSKKPKKKSMIIIGGSVLGLILLGGAGYGSFIAYDNSQKVDVPKAVSFIQQDDDVDKACDDFKKIGLNCSVVLKTDDKAERGSLLSQSIASDERVDKKSKITLTYSKGFSETDFPNFHNQSLNDTKKELYKMGVDIKEIQEVDGNGLSKDQVVSTSIEPGKKVKNGDSVVLQVSNGKINIPDWKGKTKEFVEADAEQKGITNIKFVEQESSEAPGIVLSQTPDPGSTNNSDEIQVVIAKAFKVEDIKVPDVIGKSAEDAQTELAVAGFRNIKTIQIKNSEVTEKQVTQVVPGVGQSAKSDENIVVIVSEPDNK